MILVALSKAFQNHNSYKGLLSSEQVVRNDSGATTTIRLRNGLRMCPERVKIMSCAKRIHSEYRFKRYTAVRLSLQSLITRKKK